MQENNSNIPFTWKDFLWDCITHWKWFVLSLFICLAAALYKIASSNEIYVSTASILIKTEDRNTTMRQAREAFNMMGFGNMGNNVHNELLTLSSPTLMAEVIEKMHLHETFHIKEGLKRRELYKKEPVLVIFEAPGKLPRILNFEILIVSDSKFELKKFKFSNEDYSDNITLRAGEYGETPVGRCLLSPTEHFSEDMIGKTLYYMRAEPILIADSYSKNLDIAIPDREATVITLDFKDASPQKATDLINTLIQIYNENWVANQNAKIRSVTEMVNTRIDITLKELNEAETNISSYMSKNLISDFEQASSAYFRQNMELTKSVMDYRTQVNIAKSMLGMLNEGEYLTLPANSQIGSNIESEIREYNQLVLERNKLLTNTSPSNSIVSNMTSSIQAIRESIETSLKGVINNMNTTLSDLESQMLTSQQQLANTPIEAHNLANVKREQKIKEELYLFLLEKREENSMSQSFASDNTRIIVSPHSSILPIAPNNRLIFLAFLIISLALPVALLLLKALFDTTIHTKKDLETLKASFLGEIPLAKQNKRWKTVTKWLKKLQKNKEEEKFEVMVRKNSRNIINESFRILRTKLDFMNKAGQNQVFILTSIQPGSGKSFLSMNLATSYALKGSRVIVIDMDLRRATSSKYVIESKHAKGIADYLSEANDDYKKIVIKEPITEGFDFIPVGTIPPNPAELILSDKLHTLIEKLRQEYDYIFLDCPPIDIVAESIEIARYADMALFVARAGLFEKALLPEIDELYNKKVFKNMVVVLNGVTEGGHYGKYGYGRYGNGYHSYYNEN